MENVFALLIGFSFIVLGCIASPHIVHLLSIAGAIHGNRNHAMSLKLIQVGQQNYYGIINSKSEDYHHCQYEDLGGGAFSMRAGLDLIRCAHVHTSDIKITI